MDCLSDQLLLEAYNKAVEMTLEEDFIGLLLAELNRRNINVEKVDKVNSV